MKLKELAEITRTEICITKNPTGAFGQVLVSLRGKDGGYEVCYLDKLTNNLSTLADPNDFHHASAYGATKEDALEKLCKRLQCKVLVPGPANPRATQYPIPQTLTA